MLSCTTCRLLGGTMTGKGALTAGALGCGWHGTGMKAVKGPGDWLPIRTLEFAHSATLLCVCLPELEAGLLHA